MPFRAAMRSIVRFRTTWGHTYVDPLRNEYEKPHYNGAHYTRIVRMGLRCVLGCV